MVRKHARRAVKAAFAVALAIPIVLGGTANAKTTMGPTIRQASHTPTGIATIRSCTSMRICRTCITRMGTRLRRPSIRPAAQEVSFRELLTRQATVGADRTRVEQQVSRSRP